MLIIPLQVSSKNMKKFPLKLQGRSNSGSTITIFNNSDNGFCITCIEKYLKRKYYNPLKRETLSIFYAIWMHPLHMHDMLTTKDF